jgi:hypothetical protein
VSSDGRDVSEIMGNLLPEVSEASVSAGASGLRFDPVARTNELEGIWKLLHPNDAPTFAAPAFSSAVPNQVGPFNWSPIVFGGGVPVGGWAQLTLFRNGVVNFTGHFHVSGAPSYNVTCAFAVRAGAGPGATAFTFAKTGRVHGTFESGSRDFNWDDTPTNPAVAADWENLVSSWAWQAKVGANIDLLSTTQSAVQALGQVAAVIAVIT